jgi:outer membrane receptor for ferrienterochelin and colicin
VVFIVKASQSHQSKWFTGLLFIVMTQITGITAAQASEVVKVVDSLQTPVELKDWQLASTEAAQLLESPEEEITVTGTRSQPVPNYIPQAGIQRNEFEGQNNRRLGDILEKLPGVVVDGPPGENNDVRLRGLDKEFTRTQIDGFTLPDGGEKREFQVNRLPASQVESVTIIRNPTAEFESDGIAGRIDVKTKPVPERFFLEGRYGSLGQDRIGGDGFNFSLGIGDRPTPGFGYLGAINILKKPLEIDKLKIFSVGTRESETEIQNQRYTDYSFSLGFPYRNGEITVKPIFLDFNNQKEKVRLLQQPSRTPVRNVDIEDETRATRGISLSHTHRFSSGAKLDTQFGLFESSEDKFKDKREFQFSSNRFVLNKTTLETEDKQDSTVNLNTALTIPIRSGIRQDIKLGGAFRLRDRNRDKTVIEINNRGQQSIKTGPKDIYSLSEDYFAGFIQSQIYLSDRLSILPGVRIEHVTLASADASTRDGKSTRTDVNPSLHLLYRPTERLSFNAAVSRGVNRPKFDELSPFEDEKADRITIGNPQLNPATSLNLDIGGQYESKHFTLGANFFYRNIKDVIEEVDSGTVRGGKRIFQVQNVGNGWTSGVELEERLNLGFTNSSFLKGFTVWANQTFLDSALTEASGRTRRFKEQPKFLSNLGLDYTYEPWGTTFSIAWTYVGDRVEFRPTGDTKTIESFSFLSLAVRQRITSNFSLFLEASNLTNAGKQETEQFVNGASTRKTENFGKTFLLGLDWKF